MNFLSHFYFDRHSSNSNLVLGCVLPDLMKNANKSWNIHPEKKPDLFLESDALSDILTGWKRHLAVDRYFHSSDFFTQHTAAIKSIIAPALANSAVRPSFMAHIAIELMLDSLLIGTDKINPVDFYNQLASAGRHDLKTFLLLNAITDTARFFKFFDHFLEVNYLKSYSQPENIVFALNRICMRIWPDPLTQEQKLELSSILPAYQQTVAQNFCEIFDEIEQHLDLKGNPPTS